MEPQGRQGGKAAQGRELNYVPYVEGHFSPRSNLPLTELGS